MAKTVKKTDDLPEGVSETAEAKPETKEKKETAGVVIYVGPPVRGTILHSTFIIFADGVPEAYRQHPTFKHLFVPPERLDQARREIGKSGSFRNTYYKRAVEETKKKAESEG